MSLNAFSLNTKDIEQEADSSVNELYHSLDALPNTSMTERLNWFSEHFKGTVYVLGSLGEGPKGRYDQFPRYRTDAFDCDTYVNTVLALALANSLTSFKQCINKLRYQNGQVSYIKRNHFTSIDWNKNNQNRGILKDITLNIHDQNNQPVALYSASQINKPNWYAHKDPSTIRIDASTTALQAARLDELKTKTKNLEVTTAKVPYLPFTALFPENKPNFYLFSQIPNGAIIEIVRPGWDLRKQIGTYLDISHLGFAFWEKGTLYFRQASSNYGKVVNVPLIDYLKEALNSPTIKGINVQIVVPQKPGLCDPAS
ncbi:N-acetylmuramoyl-L-alanine amidase-like domain-containing protein [Legionella sp. km772]|uniref:N-acetylmuramoyl-L-alanine amidase-like domain-containing protein n=1 Tax=Legionella sp. km772 TaxID=2498111 RepID=UPI00351A606E